MCQEKFGGADLVNQKRSILVTINGASGNWNSLYQQNPINGRNTCQIVMIKPTVFMELLMRTSQEAQNYVFEIPKPKRKKNNRNASDRLLILLVHLPKEKKGPNKTNSRDNYVIDSGISTLKDKSNITHSAGFVKDELPKNIRIHEQSTISSNETKSYTKCKSNVSKHSKKHFRTHLRGRKRSGMNFCLKRSRVVMTPGRCSKIRDSKIFNLCMYDACSMIQSWRHMIYNSVHIRSI